MLNLEVNFCILTLKILYIYIYIYMFEWIYEYKFYGLKSNYSSPLTSGVDRILVEGEQD